MKNLIKPLEWEIRKDDVPVHIAKACNAHYRILQFDKNSFFPDIRYFGDHYPQLSGLFMSELGKTRVEHLTLKAAKAACEKHYIKMILEALSPEARDILEKHLNP